MYAIARPRVVCSADKTDKFSLSQVANNRTVRRLKKLEVARVARFKAVGHRLAEAAKQVDAEARTAWAQDLDDITKALVDLVLHPDEDKTDRDH